MTGQAPVFASQQPGPWASGYVFPNQGGQQAAAGSTGGQQAAAGSTWSKIGIGMMAAGTAMQAISAFYAAKSQKRMLRMKAKELEFQQTMAEMNARRSEQEAESILRAGQAQAMQQTMQAGQVRASQKAGLAAKGIEAGLGTMMDILKSTDVIKDIDLTTINDNSARAAAAARLRTSDIRIQGTLLGAQSKMAMAAAGAVSPVAGVMTSLLSGGGQAATLYAQEQRAARYYSSLNPNAAGYNPRLAD